MSDDSYRPGQLVVDGVFESGKTVYSDAYEEVRHLDKKELLVDLYSFLNTESESTKRQHGYFIIGNIAKNSKDIDATKYLVEALTKEKDKNTLITILNLLPDLFKPLSIDLSPIFQLTSNRNWHVRGLSFAALTNTENKVEDFLIDKLKSTDNKDDILTRVLRKASCVLN
jgi:HEAT repeat protein